MAADSTSSRRSTGIWTLGRKVDCYLCSVEALRVHSRVGLHCDQNLFAGGNVRQQFDRFEVVAHGDAAAVDVDDLRQRQMRIDGGMKPDRSACQVVAFERFGNLNPPTKPYPFLPQIAARLCNRPC